MKGIYQIGDEVIFHDPDHEMAKIFAKLDPCYEVKSIQPGRGFIPKFQMLHHEMVHIDNPLIEMRSEDLMETLNRSPQHVNILSGGEIVSKLDILHALSLESVSDCRLCGWDCGVNRYQDSRGKCGLRSEAFWKIPFIHIAEEAVINPAIVVNFMCCALRCQYCIEHETWKMPSHPPLGSTVLWDQILALYKHDMPVTSLEFTNPTESLPGLIRILRYAPADFALPVVLNCHLFGSRSFYDLASQVTDVWLPDLRYGNDKCAKKLSGIDNYMKYAKIGLDAIRGSRVLVRILVLPGHVDCCHAPALELLSEYKDDVWVSILDQYVPEYKAYLDPDLSRRPAKEEISKVESLVDRYGLRNAGKDCIDFWTC